MAILKDERSGITLTLSGYDELSKKLDDTNKTKMSETLLLAAEPIIKAALDAEMTRHPGKLQQSLQSTGAQQNSSGKWYLAYRATSGNESPGEKTNPEKMIYLINREYIRKRKTKSGKPIREYVIPADDVIGEAISQCEKAVVQAMQDAFNREMERIW